MFSAGETKILAVVVFATIGLILLGLAARYVRRLPYTPLQTVLLTWNLFMSRVLWRTRISGRLPVPRDQGAVIVCNHCSPADPGYIALATDRIVHWMVAKEYCLHPALAWFFRAFEAVPTGRGGIDTGATKRMIRYAHEGGLVGLFPEGRINTTDRLLLPGRPGAALIALKARVPVVPCYVSGSPYDGTPLGCMFMSAKVRLKVGRPIDISKYYGRENEREVLEHLTKQFMAAIAALAGRPDYQGELAGRFYKPVLRGQ